MTAELTTLDVKALMNSEKLREDDNDNENFEDIDDLMNDDIINNYKAKQEENQKENQKENQEQQFQQIETEVESQQQPSYNPKPFESYDPNDFKEMLENGEFENLTPQQQRFAKMDLIMKLADLVKRNGIQITTDYTMDSDYYEIKREYDYHIRVRSKKRAISTIYSGMICGAKAIEFLNNKFDPFGVNLNGFTLNLEASREEMLDVLTELYDKYFGVSGGEISPEMQLMLIIIKAMIMTMVTNYASSYMSSLFDKPSLSKEELKKQFAKQSQPQPQQHIQAFERGTDVMAEYKKEMDLRDIKLTPVPTFDSDSESDDESDDE